MDSRDYFSAPREEMLGFVPTAAQTILEIGCGDGAFARELIGRRGGREYWGVEPNRESAERATSVMTKVLHGTFEERHAELPNHYFDAIVFNDVLEHLVDPWGSLSKASSKLNANSGVVIASIPNIRHWSVVKALWLSGDWTYTDAGIMDRTHLRFFTRSTVCEMVESTGYRLLALRGINAEPLPWKFALLSRIFAKKAAEMAYLQYALVASPAKARAY
jgi:2-polyprenyl-3-methyl-5-hydroxy-6-metoxy-1,4-benzoquinol methylase